MTDTTQPTEEVVAAADTGMSDFDKNLEDFLNYNSMEKTPDGETLVDPNAPTHAVDEPVQVNDKTVTVKGPSTAEAPIEPSGNATQVASGNTTVTGNTTTAPTDQVDPALVMEMLGLGKDKPQTVVANTTATVVAPTDPSAPAADEPYVPFRSDFVLPPALQQALFESEDTETRSKALTALLASAMNAVAQTIDQRYKDHYAPKTIEAFYSRNNQAQQQAAFVNDFFDETNGFPDLKAHGKVVQRAIEVLSAQDPTLDWKVGREKVAALARRTVAQLTGQPAVTSVAKPAKALPPKNPQHDAFISGGARPAGAGDPVDQNTAAAVFADLSQF